MNQLKNIKKYEENPNIGLYIEEIFIIDGYTPKIIYIQNNNNEIIDTKKINIENGSINVR